MCTVPETSGAWGEGGGHLVEGDEVLESIEGHTSFEGGQAVGGQLEGNGSVSPCCSS